MIGLAVGVVSLIVVFVSLCVANLGALTLNDLSRFTVTRVMVFILNASKAGDEFCELLLLALWRSYFGVKGIQAFLITVSVVSESSNTTLMMRK